MDAQIAKLKEWVDASDNIVFFRRRGRFNGVRHPGFPLGGRVIQPTVQISARKPSSAIRFSWPSPEEFFRFYRAKMLALDAQPQRRASEARGMGAHGKMPGSRHAETSTACTRRPAPRRCSSCTAQCCATTVCAATSRMTCAISPQARACPRCSCGGTIKPDVGAL